MTTSKALLKTHVAKTYNYVFIPSINKKAVKKKPSLLSYFEFLNNKILIFFSLSLKTV